MRFPSSRAPAPTGPTAGPIRSIQPRSNTTDPDANIANIHSGGVSRRAQQRGTPDPVRDRLLRPARLRHRDPVFADVRRTPGYRRRRDRPVALGLLGDAVHFRAAARAAFRSNRPPSDHHVGAARLVAQLPDLWLHEFVCRPADLARGAWRVRGDDLDRAGLCRRHHRRLKARAGDGNDRGGVRIGLRAGAGGWRPARRGQLAHAGVFRGGVDLRQFDIRGCLAARIAPAARPRARHGARGA